MPRPPSSPAMSIPCPAGHAEAGAFCARRGAEQYGWYCAARKRAAGLEPPPGGPAPSGGQRRHPERKKKITDPPPYAMEE